jgi:hypothetical protein
VIAAAFPRASAERHERAQRREVPGREVAGGNRHPFRSVGPALGRRDAGDRLRELLPTGAPLPGARVAVAVDRHVDQPWPQGRELVGAEAAPREGAGSVALSEYVGLADQLAQPRRVVGLVEIEEGRELAVVRVHHEGVRIGQPGRGDVEHVGAVLG